MWHKRIVLVEGFIRNQEEIKIELQIRVHRRVYVRDMTFLTARPAFYVTFSCFPRQLVYLLAPIKIHSITMGGNLCDDIMSEQLKI